MKFSGNYKYFIIALFFMLPPSVLLLDFFQQIGIAGYIGQSLVFLCILMITLSSFNTRELTATQRKIINLYILFIMILFFIAFIKYYDDLYYFMKMFRVFIKNIIIGLCFFIIISNKKTDISKLSNFLINLAFICSIFSLLLYFGFLFGFIQLISVHIIGRPDIFFRGAFLGYLNTIVNGVPRNQFFYTEAGQFAQYLVVPLMLSYQKFNLTKNKKILIQFIIILSAFILTFSLANIFGLMIASAFYFLLKTLISRNIYIFKRFVYIIVIIGLYLLFTNIYQISNVKTGTNVIAKQTDEHIENRIDRIIFSFAILDKDILGNIKYRENQANYLAKNRTALGNLLLCGGLPALVLIIIILGVFFKEYFRNLKYSKFGLLHIGFLGFFIGNWWYGDWIGSFFIFHLALYTTYIKLESHSIKYI